MKIINDNEVFCCTVIRLVLESTKAFTLLYRNGSSSHQPEYKLVNIANCTVASPFKLNSQSRSGKNRLKKISQQKETSYLLHHVCIASKKSEGGNALVCERYDGKAICYTLSQGLLRGMTFGSAFLSFSWESKIAFFKLSCIPCPSRKIVWNCFFFFNRPFQG